MSYYVSIVCFITMCLFYKLISKSLVFVCPVSNYIEPPYLFIHEFFTLVSVVGMRESSGYPLASIVGVRESLGYPLASIVSVRESSGYPLASIVGVRESSGYPLASIVSVR